MKYIKKIAIKVNKIFVRIISIVFYILPIKKNKIVIDNFGGNGYGDNGKYLAQELLKDKKYEIVWLLKNLNSEFPDSIKKVKIYSLKAYYHMITARLWIGTIRNSQKPVFKRKNQFYMQTWHGGLPLKYIEKDAEETLSKEYIHKAKIDGKMTDFITSSCKFRSELYKNVFWTNAKILEFGIPRDDILFDKNNQESINLRKKYNLENKFLILYAPSFRSKPGFYENLKFDTERLRKTAEEVFGKEVVIAFKIHPNDTEKVKTLNWGNYINFSDEPDSQVVLMASDLVISDYSSMLMDFILIKKPTIAFIPDYEEYSSNDRKLYFNIKSSGLPFAETFEDLLLIIKNFNNEKYIKVAEEILNYYGNFENGKSSEKIINFLKQEGVL